jgi:ribosome-binding protein aMBF1 (putative translation factor)
MQKKGNEVSVLICNSYKNVDLYEQHLENGNIKIINFQTSFYNPLQIFSLIKLIRKENYDIVHAHLFPTQYWLGLGSFFISKNTKFVKTEHNVNNRRRGLFLFKIFDKIIYKRFDTQKPKKKIYIIAHQVKALDHVSAREVVESRLNLFINLFHVFHHRSSLDVCDSCCVNRSSDNYTMILENDTNSLLKQKDLKANEAASKVDKLLENLSFSKRNNSMSRFMKALELHKLAIKTNEEENQLLDLWAALETLLQNKPESSLSRIEQISNSLIPFLSYGYIELLVIELFKDLWNWNSEVVDGLIQSVESDTSKRIEGLLKILVVKEFDEKRIELISKLDKYPLLKNRIFLYNKWFSSPKEMCSMIERHSQKLEWQIRRIYRARNMVIHHGGKPQHLKVLIENMGSYIHAIIEGLEFLMNDLKIRSIEHGVIEMEIAYKNNLDAIRANSDIKSENLKEIFLLNK